MEIGETLYFTQRNEWRNWLQNNHAIKDEIWLIYPIKQTGKPKIPYDDAVEEALCFGWIDSIIKKPDSDHAAQRYSPRRKKSQLSVLNKERIKKLIHAGKMTDAGLDSIKEHLVQDKSGNWIPAPYILPEDILLEIKKDQEVWDNFTSFPDSYKNIRVGFIDNARTRPEEFVKRLNHFIKMTKKNKMFGTLVE